MKKGTTLLFGSAVACIAIALFAYLVFFTTASEHHLVIERELYVGDVVLHVALADTSQEREQGLSGTSPLSDTEGMLFIFDNDAQHSFWMKDMNYAIDIIWFSAEQRIVHIEKAVSPDTFPSAFTPPTPARYVLEVPAGFSEAHSLTIGSTFRF